MTVPTLTERRSRPASRIAWATARPVRGQPVRWPEEPVRLGSRSDACIARERPMTPPGDAPSGSLSVRNVREKARARAAALHRAGQLRLVTPAGAGDARRADLALVADRAPQGSEVLVVDDVDLLPAERARLEAPASRGGPFPGGPRLRSRVRASPRCFATCVAPACSLRRDQNGMSSSAEPPAAATGACCEVRRCPRERRSAA